MLRTRPWLLFLVALVLAGACRCDEPGVGGARGDFRPQDTQVDFGRVLEGTQSRRTVTLLGTGRAGVTVTASASAPFSVTQGTVSVPGGGTATLEVVFTAGNGPAEGTLELTAGSRAESVALKGLGVRPLACVPTAQCVQSRFELEPGVCVESPLPDGTTCVPSSLCQERGRCQAGVCVGEPRLCDDDDPCTVDSCSATEGCVTEPVACPQPANPCRVGVCQRERGCGEADAADYSICGPVDCRTASVCFSGTCRTVPTPDGFVCSPATPCQGEGRCQSGECQRPDAGDLVPSFSQGLGGVPVAETGGPVLLSYGGALFTSVCADDAGCRLVSFTENGLLRFEAPYTDGGVRTLLAVSDAGVLLHEPESLEGYGRAIPGERLWQASLREQRPPDVQGEPSTGVGRVAVTAEGEVVSLIAWQAPEDAGRELDGGVDAGASEALATLVVFGTDGGVRRSGTVEGFGAGDSRVALDEQGLVLLCAQGGGQLSRAEPQPEDAGTGFVTVPLLDTDRDGGASLAVAGGRLFAGTRRFASTDGGNLAHVSWDGGTQPLMPLDEPALLLGDVGYAFARTCPDAGPGSCAPEQERLVLRALNARTGETAWEAPVLPLDEPSILHEASLVSGGAVGALTSTALDGGGPLASIQFLSAQGQLVCPLPGTPRIAGAVHVGRNLYVVLERDGVWKLEAFDLGPNGLAEQHGWPQRHGVQGTRRARP
ncbi:hypothetical protein [Hyalangium rubrum]|uniref:Lipoprotein n=1 Tax=Hyalangium rubrum TaxID=3103134 RepID=A0ABU5H1W2_9BACT|nr:hypothetical protein [Hyalangium sp. s54d21]MDY7227447.1 hypothetical protein [Hyalangium sp. s54d21]